MSMYEKNFTNPKCYLNPHVSEVLKGSVPDFKIVLVWTTTKKGETSLFINKSDMHLLT